MHRTTSNRAHHRSHHNKPRRPIRRAAQGAQPRHGRYDYHRNSVQQVVVVGRISTSTNLLTTSADAGRAHGDVAAPVRGNVAASVRGQSEGAGAYRRVAMRSAACAMHMGFRGRSSGISTTQNTSASNSSGHHQEANGSCCLGRCRPTRRRPGVARGTPLQNTPFSRVPTQSRRWRKSPRACEAEAGEVEVSGRL